MLSGGFSALGGMHTAVVESPMTVIVLTGPTGTNVADLIIGVVLAATE